MPAHDFSLGEGDDQVVWSVPVFDSLGNQVDPHGGSVKLHYRIDDLSAAAIETDGTIVTPVVGQPDWAAFTFLRAMTLGKAGVYIATWLVTLASTERISYPPIAADRYMTFEVKALP
jgi:hypothetical protein